MLVFPAGELPLLGRGKGVRMIGIPSAKAGEEKMIAAIVVPQGRGIKVVAGQRHTVIKAGDLAQYAGERGRRGQKLPQGFRRVDRLELA